MKAVVVYVGDAENRDKRTKVADLKKLGGRQKRRRRHPKSIIINQET